MQQNLKDAIDKLPKYEIFMDGAVKESASGRFLLISDVVKLFGDHNASADAAQDSQPANS